MGAFSRVGNFRWRRRGWRWRRGEGGVSDGKSEVERERESYNIEARSNVCTCAGNADLMSIDEYRQSMHGFVKVAPECVSSWLALNVISG